MKCWQDIITIITRIITSVDPAALAAAIRVRELLAVAWLASRVGEDSQIAVRARHRLSDALSGRDGSWLA